MGLLGRPGVGARVALTMLACSLMARCVAGQAAPVARGVDASTLVDGVRGAIRAQGCDPEKRRFDIVIAVMTSHFGSDPGHADGLRRLAGDFIRRFSSQGDRVLVAAWEMDFWEGRGPLVLSRDTPEGRVSEVQPSLPRTPQAGSVGGHDTERSLVSLWTDVVRKRLDPNSTVVVLLAPEEASMLPPGGGDRLMGANSSVYRRLMGEVVRVGGIRTEFECTKAGTDNVWIPRSATAVVVVPRSLTGRVGNVQRGGAAQSPWLMYLVGAGGLAALGWLLYRLVAHGGQSPARVATGGRGPIHKGMPTTLTVGDREFDLTGLAEQARFLIVGDGYHDCDATNVAVAKPTDGEPPPVVLVELVFTPKAKSVAAVPMAGVTLTVGTAISQGRTELPAGKSVLRMRGKAASDDPIIEADFFSASTEVYY